jgi:hypothetical protein
MEIRDATPEEEIAFYGRHDDNVRDLKCAVIDGAVVAMSGVLRDPRFADTIFEERGRWFGFLELAPGAAPLGWRAVAAIRAYLRQRTEPIIVQWDDALPKAERLLTVLGFQRTDEFIHDFRDPSRKLRIWQWQPSPQ